jgi:hypothetical protein
MMTAIQWNDRRAHWLAAIQRTTALTMMQPHTTFPCATAPLIGDLAAQIMPMANRTSPATIETAAALPSTENVF